MSAGPAIADEDIHAYVDGALAADRRVEVERRLAAEPEAARRVAALVEQRRALRAALAPIAAETVPEALDLGRLVAASRRGSGAASRRRGWRSAAAAAVLLAAGGVGGWWARGTTEPPTGLSALVGEASATYAAYADGSLRRVGAGVDDQADMLRWIGERLHRTVSPFDLTGYGFRLVSGRLVATPNGPAGMFVYDDDHGTHILVMTRPMATDAAMPMRRDDQGGTKGFVWADGGMGFSLVGSADAVELHPIADEIRRQIERKV